jgi:hypothetical protein
MLHRCTASVAAVVPAQALLCVMKPRRQQRNDFYKMRMFARGTSTLL